MEEISLTEKNKTLKHLKHIVKQYDKPEPILNIIVQGSECDNKILTLNHFIVFYMLMQKRNPVICRH